MTFHRLLGISKAKHTRLKFDLEKLKDANMLEIFDAMMGGKVASLTTMNNEDAGMDSMSTTFKTAVNEAASEIFSKLGQKKNKTKTK